MKIPEEKQTDQNKKMIEQAIIHFKKVAEDENHEKRSDAMFNIALIYVQV